MILNYERIQYMYSHYNFHTMMHSIDRKLCQLHAFYLFNLLEKLRKETKSVGEISGKGGGGGGGDATPWPSNLFVSQTHCEDIFFFLLSYFSQQNERQFYWTR